jgi:fructose-1-phosphate kinase PfkB-like protein
LHPINQDVNNSNGSKQNLLIKHLFNEDGEGPVEVLKGNKLHQVMDKFMTLCCPNIRNLEALFKHHLDNKEYIDNIVALKFKSVRAVQIVYGLDDPSKPMVDRKQTYYFHWSQLMDKHIKKHRKLKM